jgi:hypothetical protein
MALRRICLKFCLTAMRSGALELDSRDLVWMEHGNAYLSDVKCCLCA